MSIVRQTLARPATTVYSLASSSLSSRSHLRPSTSTLPLLLPRRSIISTPTAGTLPVLGADAGAYEGMPHEGLRLVLFGKPGSGKGTLSQMVMDTYPDVNLVSVGDVLRKEIAEGSEIGQHAKKLVAKGEFVPDEVMIKIALAALEPLRSSNWILDGFPRTLNQGVLLDAELAKAGNPLSLIINLAVKDETILDRISDRMIHVPSGRVYNNSYNKPKIEGVDDITGEPLTKRPDDNFEVFQRRLALYNQQTYPLLEYYGSFASQNLHELKGETSDEIWPDMHKLLQQVLGR